MSINPVSVNFENGKSNNKTAKPVSFGNFNPIILLMDGMDKGGFAATFIVQDFLGMAAPRTLAGLTRNSKDTGEKNTAYARLVAIREILSGPSTFIIPGLMIYAIKGIFGRANDVPVNFIKGFSDHFEDFAAKHSNKLTNPQELKEAFYKNAIRNLLDSSTIDNTTKKHYLTGAELDREVEKFTKLIIEIDKAPKKHFWNFSKTNKEGQKYAQILKGDFVEGFVELRKAHSDNPSNKIMKAWFKLKKDIPNISDLDISTNVSTFIDNLMDYTNDITKTISKKFKSGTNIQKLVEDFCHKRVASRFLTNTTMTAAVIAFFLIIPKLYNSKDGKNPALAGLDADEQHPAKKGEVKNANK